MLTKYITHLITILLIFLILFALYLIGNSFLSIADPSYNSSIIIDIVAGMLLVITTIAAISYVFFIYTNIYNVVKSFLRGLKNE